MFSLARTLFSPGSAEDRSSLFVWFIDTMVRSDSSGACASAVWLCAFADRPRSLLGRGAPEVSRFSCRLFLSVPGFSDYAGPTARSRLSRNSRVAFLQSGESRRPGFAFFEGSIARPTDAPVYASSDTSRCHLQDWGPRWSRCLLSCRTLSFPTTCRFIPAHREVTRLPDICSSIPEVPKTSWSQQMGP